MLESTSKFKVQRIIYNKGGFAIAVGQWADRDGPGIGCRWHDDKLGYPQTFGKPQWMALPDNVVARVSDITDPESKVEIVFK